MGQSNKKSLRSAIRSAGEGFTRELIFPDLNPSYNKFKQKLGPQLDAAITAITEAHLELQETNTRWPRERQKSYVRLFLYTSLNNLVLATHFIAAGYLQPAGQQLRSHAEAIAMAFMLMLPDQWERFAVAPAKYPAHDALHNVQKRKNMRRLEAMIPLDAANWAAFVRSWKLYDHHSHAGALSASLHLRIAWPVRSILGGEYDPAKRDQYAADLRRITLGARSLKAVTTSIVEHYSPDPTP